MTLLAIQIVVAVILFGAGGYNLFAAGVLTLWGKFAGPVSAFERSLSVFFALLGAACWFAAAHVVPLTITLVR